jgi:hypothetical protein
LAKTLSGFFDGVPCSGWGAAPCSAGAATAIDETKTNTPKTTLPKKLFLTVNPFLPANFLRYYNSDFCCAFSDFNIKQKRKTKFGAGPDGARHHDIIFIEPFY